MKRSIFIAGINRSGGSLLARLFDGHPAIASYPMEVGFKFNKNIYGFLDKITGSPTYIPKFEKNLNLIEYFDAKNEDVAFVWGKEKSEKFGIRKNYLEKAFYETNLKTNFDYDNYILKLNTYCKEAENNQQLYEGKHKAYFESWDTGKHNKDAEVVLTHDSNGLYLNNFEDYFKDFPKSVVAAPVRDILGYVAAEKTRIARRYFGSKRFAKPLPPNFLIKSFDQYDIEAIIRTWSVSLTRIRLLQEKLGVDNNFIVYRFENLTNDPKQIVDYISQKIDIKILPIIYQPTLMNKPWLGNSQQGKNNGINKNPNSYYIDILTKKEIDLISQKTEKIMNDLSAINNCPLDLTKISNDKFFDYYNQKNYSSNNDNWSLYCAFAFAGFRKLKLTNISYLAFVALIFKLIVRISHLPRLFKQKHLKGFGKQNYT